MTPTHPTVVLAMATDAAQIPDAETVRKPQPTIRIPAALADGTEVGTKTIGAAQPGHADPSLLRSLITT